MKKAGWGVTALLLFLLWSGAVPSAAAHAGNTGFSTLKVEDHSIRYDLFLTEMSLLPYDSSQDGKVTKGELESGHIGDYLSRRLSLSNEGVPMTFRLEGIEEENKDVIPGFTFHLVYRSGSAVTSLLVQYELLFDDYDREHVNQLVLLDGPDFADQTIFNADNRSYLYISEEDKGMLPVLGQYFIQGIRHISSGYDHLLFLLVLLLAATRLKEAAAIVTTFTAAHSLTLILAAARIIVFPSRWIEAVIALSIAYVALENAFARRTVPRLPLVFLFGLVHGLGFAGALAELGLPERNLIATLLSFNLGVEAGQLALVLAVFPLLLRARSQGWYPAASLILSLSAAGLALYWVIERAGWLG